MDIIGFATSMEEETKQPAATTGKLWERIRRLGDFTGNCKDINANSFNQAVTGSTPTNPTT